MTLSEIALACLTAAGERGMTVAEFRDNVESHHGSMSGTLSNLHYEEVVALLAETRGGCHPYVLTEFVGDRETVLHRGLVTTKAERDRAKRVLAVVEEWMVPAPHPITGRSTKSKAEKWPVLFSAKVRAAWGEVE